MEDKQSLETVKKEIINVIDSQEKLSESLTIEDVCKMDGYAYNIANSIKNDRKNNVKLQTAQLRKIYEMFITLKNDDQFKEKLYGILPLIAYSVGRKLCPNEFYEILEKCVEKVKDKKDLEILIKLFESIVAYDKYLSEK